MRKLGVRFFGLPFRRAPLIEFWSIDLFNIETACADGQASAMYSQCRFLALNQVVESVLKGPFSRQYRADTDKDRRTDEYQEPEDELLESGHLAEIDSVETSLCHGGGDEEERIGVGDTLRRSRRSPEDERGHETYDHKVGVMDRDEIEFREMSLDPSNIFIPHEVFEWMYFVAPSHGFELGSRSGS